MIEMYCKVLALFTAERDEEKGATAVEYGLLVALIAAIIIGVVVLLGQNILEAFTQVNDELDENMN